MRAGQPRELARLLDTAGRATRWPKKHGERLQLLHYLVQRFEAGREYNEAEVNSLLNEWHTFADPALLRRFMYNEGLLGRTVDGARYWRVEH